MNTNELKFWYPNIAIFLFMPFTIFFQSRYANILYFINVLNIVYFLIRYFDSYRKLFKNKFILCYCFFNFFVILSCILNNKLTFGIIYSIVSIFITIGIIFFNKTSIIFHLSNLFRIIIVLNFISYLLRDILFNEVIAISLIGNKNDMAIFLIPMITVLFINHIKENKQSDLFISILGAISMMFGGSGTGIVCSIICIIIMIGYKYIVINKKFILSIFILFFILLVFDETNFLKGITNLLQKDITFSNRTIIWQMSLNNFLSSPIIGFGRGAIVATVNLYGDTFHDFTSTHNIILQVLLEGGILAIIPFLTLIKLTLKKIKMSNDIGKISLLFFIAYFIAGLMESFANHFLFWIFMACLYVLNSNNQSENIK